MRQLGLLAVLLCNAGITVSYSSNYDASSHEGRINDERFNLLELLKNKQDNSEEDAAGQRETTEPGYLENWTGQWFPHRSDDPPRPPKVWPSGKHISNGSSSMGKPNNACDDGKSNLEMDWDKSAVNYTCYGEKIMPDAKTRPILESVAIPPAYRAARRCMNETIEYDEDLPVCGTHRPVSPVYGEYTFLPIQRWLHSLEHGAVVALYHPCANPLEIRRLKKMVRRCLRRHIITPYQRLERQRPLALLARGYRLTMAYVDPELLRDFIRAQSLQAPDNIPTDGLFDDGLASKAQLVSDLNDSAICPNM